MDKQFLLMVAVTLIGIFGGLGFGPYFALLVYYFNTVLRPQNLWGHISSVKETQWSLAVALIAIGTSVLYRVGLIHYASCGPTRGAKQAFWNPIHWLLLGFAGWITIRWALTSIYGTSAEVAASDKSYNEYYKLFLMWIVASLVIYRMNQLWALLIVITLADIYVAYEANAMYLLFRVNTIETNGFGGLDNNGAGLMIAMGIPLCFFIWEGMKSRFRWVFFGVIPILGHAVMLTYSRGAMVSVIASVPVIFAFSRHKKWFPLVFILGLGAVGYSAGDRLRDRFMSIKAHEVDESANDRKRAWAGATQMANERPFFGVGLRCSQLYLHEYGGNAKQAIHSQYFQTAADAGWVGMAWFVALVTVILWTCSRLFWRTRRWAPFPEVVRFRAMVGGLSASIVTYCTGAFFLSLDNFEMPYVLFLLVAQLWGVFKGGGVEATAREDGTLPPLELPPPPQRTRNFGRPPLIPLTPAV